MDMDGLKTSLLAGFTALLNAFVAFGWDITPEQKVAVMGLGNMVVIPILQVLIRIRTKAPMRGFVNVQKTLGVLR